MKEFEEIYKTYYKDVYRFIYKTTGGNHELSEELTQDTFFEAYRSFHRYNGSCSVLTWLCAISKNLWFHYLRKHKNVTVNLEALEETLYDDYEKTPEACVERSEKSAVIRRCSLMAKLELPKLTSRVRFPSPAPQRPLTAMVRGFFR